MSRIFFKKKQQPASPFASVALSTALITVLLLVIAGPLYQSGLWGSGENDPDDLAIRLSLTAIGGLLTAIGGVSVVISSLHTLVSPRVRMSWRGGYGTALTVVLLAVYGYLLVGYVSNPVLHDVSTDPDNPPGFVAIDQRSYGDDVLGGRNDPDFAAKRARISPAVEPVLLPLDDMDRAMALVEAAAVRCGWTVVDKSVDAGRLEAYDMVAWFGFRDNIVLRLTRQENGILVDMRSMSAVGRSDLGVNARRLRNYRDELREAAAAFTN